MISLQHHLDQSTHRQLELIARAHQLPFTRRVPRADGLARLSASLHAGAYARAVDGLSDDEIEALQALVIAGGWLPLPLFAHHFGIIRRYRPWRADFAPRHPWRYPASPAERLFQLGMIHLRDDEMVGIIAEAEALLPPLARPQALVDAGGQSTGALAENHLSRSALLRDVAGLLGTLMQVEARALHGRWLSLSVMRRINARLSAPECLDEVRSELQSGRLRWLHYLAQVAGLLTVQAGRFLPTVAAWRWLSAPPDAQWDALMQSIERDLDGRERLWDQFRFPAIGCTTWQVMRHTLDDLSPERSYRVRDWFTTLSPYLLPDSRYAVACTLHDLFAWSGVVVVRHGRFYVHHHGLWMPSSRQPTLLCDEKAVRLTVHHLPPSPALVTLHAVAHIADGIATVDAGAMREAVRQSIDAVSIVDALATLSGEPVPVAVQQQILAWEATAQRLTLRSMIILHSPDATLLDAIRDDWRLATHFDGQLSPHHLAIHAADADKLHQRLDRRGYEVTSLLASTEPSRVTEQLNPSMAEYLLLAVWTYQQLHSRLDASVRIPKALTHWLEERVINSDTVATIETEVKRMVSAVQQQTPSLNPIVDSGRQDEATIRRLMQRAHEHTIPVTIDYYSPYLDEMSTRQITVHEIYDSDALTYIEAHCHLVDDTRTFRMDRIQRVHDDFGDRRALAI